MMTDFGDLLAGRPLVVILRGMDAERALPLAEMVWSADAGIVEVPIQSPASLDALRVLSRRGRETGQPVGAGTVRTVDHVRQAAEAGAAFTVAPGLSADVVHAARDAGLAHLPGVATATEVDQALQLDCRWLKAFPASALGPSWIAAMAGPFPGAQFVATGGIGAGNGRAFLDAGAGALGVGGSIAAAEDLADLLEAIR